MGYLGNVFKHIVRITYQDVTENKYAVVNGKMNVDGEYNFRAGPREAHGIK